AMTFYADGVPFQTDTSGSVSSPTSAVLGAVGATPNGAGDYTQFNIPAIMDQTMFFGTGMGTADILTMYNDQCCSARLWTLGSEQTNGGGGATPAGTPARINIIQGAMQLLQGMITIF